MTGRAVITGTACRIERPLSGRIETAIRQCVLTALEASTLAIGDIDTFVTVGSDTTDGQMLPGRSEIAGAYGRKYLHLPSGAGHGLAAAAMQIEAGEARNLVLVGWGAATKLNDYDVRSNQADPFFARPMGASPRVVAALQAQELLGLDGMDDARLKTYVETMQFRAWQAGTFSAPSESAPAWARSAFCDGVVALVVRHSSEVGHGVTIGEVASVSRPYSPEDERLDTAVWVQEALADLVKSEVITNGSLDIVEVAAPTPIAELRACAGIGPAMAGGNESFNQSGGGAIAYFGVATGLRQIAAASRGLMERHKAGLTSTAGSVRPACGLALDLNGPLGQHVTAVVLQTGANP